MCVKCWEQQFLKRFFSIFTVFCLETFFFVCGVCQRIYSAAIFFLPAAQPSLAVSCYQSSQIFIRILGMKSAAAVLRKVKSFSS